MSIHALPPEVIRRIIHFSGALKPSDVPALLLTSPTFNTAGRTLPWWERMTWYLESNNDVKLLLQSRTRFGVPAPPPPIIKSLIVSSRDNGGADEAWLEVGLRIIGAWERMDLTGSPPDQGLIMPFKLVGMGKSHQYRILRISDVYMHGDVPTGRSSITTLLVHCLVPDTGDNLSYWLGSLSSTLTSIYLGYIAIPDIQNPGTVQNLGADMLAALSASPTSQATITCIDISELVYNLQLLPFRILGYFKHLAKLAIRAEIGAEILIRNITSECQIVRFVVGFGGIEAGGENNAVVRSLILALGTTRVERYELLDSTSWTGLTRRRVNSLNPVWTLYRIICGPN